MALSATEISNSTAGRYDVELRFYGGLAYSALTLLSYVSGAIDPSVVGWTDITARVNDAGSLTYGREGNSLRWSAQLAGTNYADTYFAPGQAILCLRRVLIGSTQTVPASGTWELWWLGQIISGSMQDDYKHGGAWTRQLAGLDSALQRATAPRLTAGRINLMANASVTASSTLINPALEAGTGEFVGTLVAVPASNTIDGNVNTLWISDDAPHSDSVTPGTAKFQKVFSKPLAGYSQAKTWWIELEGDFPASDWYLQTSAGLILHLNVGDAGEAVRGADGTGNHIIVCGSEADFEVYTGGAQNGAVIVDGKTWPHQATWDSIYNGRSGTFTIDPTADWLYLRRNDDPSATPDGTIYAAIAWNQDGSAASGLPNWDNNAPWTGAAIDVSDDVCPPGSGIRIKPSQDGGAAADYEITDLMIPDGDRTEDAIEWLKYTLAEQTAALDGAVSAGATSITLNSTLGLLDAGDAVCEADAFAYTGRTPTTLTGVTGIGNHATGAAVRQVIGGEAQSGWPCRQLSLLRPENPALPQIITGRVYLSGSATTPADPGEANWEADWDENIILLYASQVSDDIRDYGRVLAGPDGGPRWVRHVAVIFDDMTDAERARLNECELYLDQAQIANSGSGDLGDLRAVSLARYILAQSGLATALVDASADSAYGPFIGEHATAIAPYPQVLDDLARITGSIMDWGLAGVPIWYPDMWFPILLGSTQYELRAYLDATYLRDKAQYSGRKPNEVGVIVHLRTPDGRKSYSAQYPQTMTAADQRIEIDDLVTSWESMAPQIAKTQYYKAGLHYQEGAQELTFTLKGPGEWLRPEQYIALACVNATGETIVVADQTPPYTHDLVGWLTESITWEWGRQGAFRTWSATAKCRRYWR
jgi:hypothetical protein